MGWPRVFWPRSLDGTWQGEKLNPLGHQPWFGCRDRPDSRSFAMGTQNFYYRRVSFLECNGTRSLVSHILRSAIRAVLEKEFNKFLPIVLGGGMQRRFSHAVASVDLGAML